MTDKSGQANAAVTFTLLALFLGPGLFVAVEAAGLANKVT